MKKVITYGSFDLLHYGHVRLFKRAKELGDYLIVGLSTDEFNEIKKHKEAYNSYAERKYILEAIKYVVEVIPEEDWDQIIKDVQ
ncbi:adenylyltransferase/cytidyltransferase family protein, partial [Lactobacillus jensenii]|uniref:adenylyltransferase/cytidyltransferase family protein n=1 Tax=Lactobacillus jensenii TaxID=109790 RepID=UPI002870AC09